MIPPEQHYNDDQSDKMLVKIIVFFSSEIFYTIYHFLNLELCLHIQNFLVSHWVCDHCHTNRIRQLQSSYSKFSSNFFQIKTQPLFICQTTREEGKSENIRNICTQVCTRQWWVWTNFSKCLKIENLRHQNSVSVNASRHLHLLICNIAPNELLTRLSNAINSYLCPSKNLNCESPVEKKKQNFLASSYRWRGTTQQEHT